MSKAFVVRMIVWSALALYLACDFFLFTGPMKRELNEMFPTKIEEREAAMSRGICARVYNSPIFLGQVDYRVRERLWRTGRGNKLIHPQETYLLRLAALDELIDESLMRIKAKVNAKEVDVTEDEIDAEEFKFKQNFASDDELDQALAAHGIESRKELRFRLAARIQQEKYILTKIEPFLSEKSSHAKDWHEQHPTSLVMPERRHVRHLFIATLNRSSEEVKKKLSAQLVILTEGKSTFSELAAQSSEDYANNQSGGDLGWVRADRLPEDFASAVFSLPLATPRLVQTKIGWHIVEVLEIRPPEPLAFSEMKAEIEADLANTHRDEAIKQYRHQLRLISYKHVEIFPEMLKTSP